MRLELETYRVEEEEDGVSETGELSPDFTTPEETDIGDRMRSRVPLMKLTLKKGLPYIVRITY